MKNILNNRILVILSIFVILITSLCTKTFASTEGTNNNMIFTYDDTEYNINFDESLAPYKYKIIVCSINQGYYRPSIYISDSHFCFLNDEQTGAGDNLVLSKEGQRVYFYCPSGSNVTSSLNTTVKKISSFTFSSFSDVTDGSYTGFNFNQSYKATIFCGYLGFASEKDFFQPAPPVTRLAQIVEQAKTEKTLAEVVGILPLILVVVVSLVGLRKALKWLLTFLRRCLILLN